MQREQKNIFHNIDWLITGLFLVLIILGWLNIYAAVFNDDHNSIFDISQKYGKQMLWIIGAIFIAIIILIIDASFYSAFSFPVYIISIITLVLVIFLGKEISGSKSWFRFGEFGLQPAEFAKFACCIALAKYLSALEIRIDLLRTKIIASLIIILPATIIFLQKEAGTALVFIAFIFVLYREGLSGNILLGGFFTVLLLLLALLTNKIVLIIGLAIISVIISLIVWINSRSKKIARKRFFEIILLFTIASVSIYGMDYAFNKLKGHQKNRINIFLGKEEGKEVKKKAGYNINQSLIAIGSGGVFGKGFLQGTQTKYDFVPEQSTDFIFCTVGEEWGFFGSAVVLLLFLILILRIMVVAERQRSTFTRIYGYGLASILFFHLSINIGMTIGLAPIIGIPLPFFSYGGSSLWAFTILLFIFIKLDSNRLGSVRNRLK
ncbi:MAG: rod shape-determining protein RodA [Bacteroidota bacterium]